MTLPVNRKVVSGDHGRLGRTFILCNSIDGIDVQQTPELEFANTTYNYTEVADEQETTSTDGGGYDTTENGCKHIEGHMECIWDASVQYFAQVDTDFTSAEDDIPYLNPRGHYTFTGYVNASSGTTADGPYLYIYDMRVNNIAITIPAKGKVMLSFDFKSSGVYVLPGAGTPEGINDGSIHDTEEKEA